MVLLNPYSWFIAPMLSGWLKFKSCDKPRKKAEGYSCLVFFFFKILFEKSAVEDFKHFLCTV